MSFIHSPKKSQPCLLLQRDRLKKLEPVCLFFISLVVFNFGLSHHEFIQFESRFVVFAQEMLRNGISFFPTVYGNPYPDYPATYTILVYFLVLPLHKVTALAAILPTALAASTTILFVYLIGRLHARLLGFYAVLFAFFTFSFLEEARTISLDQFVCAATAISFYCVYSADFLQKKSKRWLIIISWLLSFVIRGPIGLIIPASVVASYYLVKKNGRMFIFTSVTAIISLIFCMLCLLSAAWWQGGADFVYDVLHMQAIGRLAAANPVPFYYYFTDSFIYYAPTFPIAIILVITYWQAIWRNKTNPDFHLLKLLAAWLAVILIGMSIPSDAKMRYILAITPASSLMAGYLLYLEHQHRLLNYLKTIFYYGCITLPFLGFLLLGGTFLISDHIKIKLEIPYPWIFASLGFLCISVIIYNSKRLISASAAANSLFSVTTKNKLPQQQLDKPPGNYIIGLLSFILLYALVAQPLVVQFNATRHFVETVEALRQPSQALVFYQIGPDAEDIKYKVAANNSEKPQFIQQPDELVNFKRPAIFIARTENFSQLNTAIKNHFKIILTGRLGHQDCVVFVAH